MSGDDRVTLTQESGIARVRLNRPDKHNGMDEAMLRAVIKAGKELRRDRSIRAVILSGNGPSFCAGLDFGALLADRPRAVRMGAELMKPYTNLFQEWGMVWRQLPVPVIACVHGNCFGAGIQLALAADIRIATADARLSIMESRWGLVPDMTGMLTLPELMPIDKAKELVFSGRVLTGAEGRDHGLVTYLDDDPEQRARELVAEFATRSPDAIAAAKGLIHDAYTPSSRRTLAAERRWQRKIIGRANQRIAVKSSLGSRSDDGVSPPSFVPRKLK